MKNFFTIKKFSPSCRGFMTVEILVAVSIMVISILASTAVAQKSIYVSRQAVHASQASFLLEEGAEAVRILRDNSWSNISVLTPGTIYYPLFTGGTWTLSETPQTVGIFARQVTIATVGRDSITEDISVGGTNDDNTKLITITVSWSEGGVIITKTLSFYIFNIFS